MTDAKSEIVAGARFGFGANWKRFLAGAHAENFAVAEAALARMLGVPDLHGRVFLDIGCGSGLSSLAARRLGARVVAFDFDPESVEAATALRARERPGDPDWDIAEGSVLDASAMARQPLADVVYAWGVLHHTGEMWRAIAAAAGRVANGGVLFIALYNDQGWLSHYWRWVKRAYNSGLAGRVLMVAFHAPYLLFGRWLVRLLTGRLTVERGMSLWHDMLDWLGGYPFEVASPETVISFLGDRGFVPMVVVRCGNRHGCNEFVFRRVSAANA